MQTYNEILAAMQAAFQAQAGYTPDDASDIGIRMKVLASEIERLSLRLEEVEKNAFPGTAEGEWLDRHAQTRGLARRRGQKARGSLLFSRQTPLWYDITIPAGTVCADASGQIRFVTLQQATLAAGEVQISVEAEAEEPGTRANLAEGAIQSITAPPAGISGVRNEEAFSGGTDDERDEALRLRLMDSYAMVSNGTNAAFYRDAALACPGVGSVGVIARERGPGTVNVYLAAPGGAPAQTLIAQVAQRLSSLKEINVDVSVQAAQSVAIDVAAYITVRPGYEGEAVLAACRANVQRHFAQYLVGQPFFLSAVGEVLYHTEGVQSYMFESRLSADQGISQKQIAVMGNLGLNIQQEA